MYDDDRREESVILGARRSVAPADVMLAAPVSLWRWAAAPTPLSRCARGRVAAREAAMRRAGIRAAVRRAGRADGGDRAADAHLSVPLRLVAVGPRAVA